MLHQASLADLRDGGVSRDSGHVVLTMRQHPRGVEKTLRDEYVSDLAPSAAMLKEFLALKRKLNGDHNYAFHAAGYERKFGLSEKGIAELKRLAELAKGRDVYFICQCEADQRCHRELLLLLARKWYRAETSALRFEYPIFEARIRPGERLS
ncbi:MAG: DUF488 family protein [Planctomycetota bacterium]|nr:DUF488 family protein [Planctomycetota bacterium]